MGNMIDYLTWRGDLPVSRVPLGEADLLILSRLSYLPMDGFVGEEPVSLGEVMAELSPLLGDGESQRHPLIRGDLSLAPALRDSPRFADLFLAKYENIFDPARDIQFAAVTVVLPRGIVVSFRGTDGTIVGWKEDFHLNFAETVAAQTAARDYLADAAARFPGPVTVVGHSKGGNLAVYAAAFAPAQVKRRIRAVRNHDGPGFPERVISSRAYETILPRVRTFLPQSSVVGLLMEHREETVVIRSVERALMQHDPYTWEIRRDDFERVGQLTPGSVFVDAAVKDWVNKTPPEELEKAVDAVFGILQASDAVRLRDLRTGKNSLAMLHALRELDPGTREMVKDALRFLGAALKETGIKTGEERVKERESKKYEKL
ncbi:MAG: DUF2974 domain-containing protein [Clostridia bacterium]|nr:DUF2974 domain-containing protein [Clostridia bacterium]